MTPTSKKPIHSARWRLGCLLLLPGLPLALAGCGAPEPRTLRVGLSVYPPYELLFLARESGYFRDAGLDVRLVEFEDLSDAQRAFEQGKLDGLATTLVEVLVARSAGSRDLRVVRPISVSEGADMILGLRSVAGMRDLRGRRVGLETGSLGQYMLARALEREGMTLADVVQVSMAQEAMGQALAAGAVSAVVTYPPAAGTMLRDPRVRTLFSSQDIPGEVVDVYAFDRAVVTQRRRELQLFFAALERAEQRLAQDRVASCDIMARREHMAGDAFCASLEQGIRLIPGAQQAPGPGPEAALRQAVRTVHHTLAASGLVADRPEIANCLDLLKP